MKEGHLCAICDFKEQYAYIKTSLKLSKTITKTYTLYFISDRKWQQNSQHLCGFQSGMSYIKDSTFFACPFMSNTNKNVV